MKITLEFDADSERVEASAAIAGLALLSALSSIYERARMALKHDGDPIKALEGIRQIALEAMERVGA